MEEANVTPVDARNAITDLYVRATLAKSLIEAADLDPEEVERICHLMADVELIAGNLYESFRELADVEPEEDDDDTGGFYSHPEDEGIGGSYSRPDNDWIGGSD